jgi:hypothetical protein
MDLDEYQACYLIRKSNEENDDDDADANDENERNNIENSHETKKKKLDPSFLYLANRL